MITTNCTALNWMAERVGEYLITPESKSFEFKGRVPFRMVREVRDWFNAQDGVRESDGRVTSGLTIAFPMEFYQGEDGEARYRQTVLTFSSGSMKSNECSVRLHIRMDDFELEAEDIAAILSGAVAA